MAGPMGARMLPVFCLDEAEMDHCSPCKAPPTPGRKGSDDPGFLPGRGRSGVDRRRVSRPIWFFFGMLQQELAGILAVEGSFAGEQFLKDDGQAVLIAVPAKVSRNNSGAA